MKKVLLLIVLIWNGLIVFSQGMDIETMDKIFKDNTDSIVGDPGYWEMYVNGLPMLSIADQANNRMRIITPVSELVNISPGLYQQCLEANFHSALDVKYAISDNLIWVVYIHPLQELTEDQLRSAIVQVYNAAATFGDTFTSTDLVFPKKNENERRN